MNDNKALPKGLRDEEVEKGNIKRPPVTYIPQVDPILDTVESKLCTKNFKVSLPDGTIVYHAVYDMGSSEAFVIHVSFCKRKNYYKFYKKGEKAKEDYSLRFNAAQKKSDDAIADSTHVKVMCLRL